MKVSTIIPVYKNRQLFLSNLKENFNFLKNTQVIIIDDASGENIKKEVRKISESIFVIENKKNLGFAASVNIGVSKADGKFIMLINSDVKLLDNSYKKTLIQFEKNPKLFAVSFLQIEKDGSRVGKNILFFKKGLICHSKAAEFGKGLTAWAEGGACIIRREYFEKLNGFDMIYYPFYWEDIDLSYRAYKRGWEILFDPKVVVEHYHESTIGKYFDKSDVKKVAFRNQLIFFWKNIKDKNLILKHFFYLPLNILYCFPGFLLALTRLPQIAKFRFVSKKISKLKDQEILKLF